MSLSSLSGSGSGSGSGFFSAFGSGLGCYIKNVYFIGSLFLNSRIF